MRKIGLVLALCLANLTGIAATKLPTFSPLGSEQLQYLAESFRNECPPGRVNRQPCTQLRNLQTSRALTQPTVFTGCAASEIGLGVEWDEGGDAVARVHGDASLKLSFCLAGMACSAGPTVDAHSSTTLRSYWTNATAMRASLPLHGFSFGAVREKGFRRASTGVSWNLKPREKPPSPLFQKIVDGPRSSDDPDSDAEVNGDAESDIFSVGPAGAEVSFHDHDATWLYIAAGQKLFVWQEPSALWNATDPDGKASGSRFGGAHVVRPLQLHYLNPAQLLLNHPELLERRLDQSTQPAHAFGCMVRKGDLLLMPYGFTHGTVNVQPTMAVGGSLWPYARTYRPAASRVEHTPPTASKPRWARRWMTALAGQVASFTDSRWLSSPANARRERGGVPLAHWPAVLAHLHAHEVLTAEEFCSLMNLVVGAKPTDSRPGVSHAIDGNLAWAVRGSIPDGSPVPVPYCIPAAATAAGESTEHVLNQNRKLHSRDVRTYHVGQIIGDGMQVVSIQPDSGDSGPGFVFLAVPGASNDMTGKGGNFGVPSWLTGNFPLRTCFYP
jgi:hypothetical protein